MSTSFLQVLIWSSKAVSALWAASSAGSVRLPAEEKRFCLHDGVAWETVTRGVDTGTVTGDGISANLTVCAKVLGV